MKENILQKQQTYRAQMESICNIVLDFAGGKKWRPIYRGRHACISITGPINDFDAIIDIAMWLDKWENNPSELSEDYPFELWANAFSREKDQLWYSNKEFYRMLQFKKLQTKIRKILENTWEFLSKLDKVNFILIEEQQKYKRAIQISAYSLIKLGELQKAKKEYQKYLTVYPHDKDILEAKNEIIRQ